MSLPVDPARYSAFLVTMFVMAITPGPANLFAIATGMQKGKAAALGLATLIIAFPKAFHLLAWAGAAYLVWLGIKSIRSGLKPADHAGEPRTFQMGRSAFRDGFAVQIANPKILLFFGAVLPPFIDIHRPLVPQLVMFAAATIGMDLISMSAYGLGGAALSSRMNEPGFRRGFALMVGVLLITAAALIVSRG